MRYLSAAHTDVGTTKRVNQDAFCLKIAKTKKMSIAFAVLCDGMGGLENGELASAFLVNAFSAWFETELPPLVAEGKPDLNRITSRWNDIVQEQGRKIMNFGRARGVSMGTTLTAFLAVDNAYAYIQVGDSRLYKLTTGIEQVTKDQTLVAYEMEQNRLTAEEARADTRRNILLQCVGASNAIAPETGTGIIRENDVFLLCSDGFRHEVQEPEMFGVLAPAVLTSEQIMKKALVDLVELNKSRNERDNITALVVKAIQ